MRTPWAGPWVFAPGGSDAPGSLHLPVLTVKTHQGNRIDSLTGQSHHRIVWADPDRKEYEIEYPSGNRIVVRIDDLYALYCELYARGYIDGSCISSNVQRILGWKTWHAPGRALLAILPLIDDSIRIDGGALALASEHELRPSWLLEQHHA